MNKNIIKHGLGGLIAGALCVVFVEVGDEVSETILIPFLFFGPGIVFAITMLILTSIRTRWWQKLLYFLITSGAYFAAVWILFWLVDLNFLGEQISLGLASGGGALLAGLATGILQRQQLLTRTLGAALLGLLVGAVVPYMENSGSWSPELPNVLFLYPIWQTVIGAFFGFTITPSSTTASPAPTLPPSELQ